MEGREVAGAAMTVLLVAAGVILATVIMNRFGDLLSLVEGRKGTQAGSEARSRAREGAPRLARIEEGAVQER